MSFQTIGTSSGILGYRPGWCPSPLLFLFPYLTFFFHSLSPCHWISFVFLRYDRRICSFCIHSIDSSLADGEFPGLGLALVPDVVIPKHGGARSRYLVSNFCPGRSLNLEPRSLM